MALLLCLLFTGVFSFEVSLQRRGVQCFGEDLSKGTLYVGEVSTNDKRPDYRPLSIRALFKDISVIYEKANINHDKFSFTSTDDGPHMLCIENAGQFEVWADVKILTGAAAKDYSNVASTKDLRESERKIELIKENTKQIHKELQHIREREEEMRNTNETIHSRVVAYSIFTIVFLIALALIQTLYLKRFFKSKKMI
ncbi:unnamed protein product [Blepharisma stoltei]|uniref:GOLD domain-containing protein n=1 Tax=Blepharisma stoltei TaxID=1481888 RepID=A0AAU9J2V7_9CILI|nr:unnamed protein product [Blepharisma stoltei]